MVKRKNTGSFVKKLTAILEDPMSWSCIRWVDLHSFSITNVKLFEDTVLPLYFKHRKLSSFVRQLNMYDFNKIRGNKAITFSNSQFSINATPQCFNRKRSKKSKNFEFSDQKNANLSQVEIKLQASEEANQHSDCSAVINHQKQIGGIKIQPSQQTYERKKGQSGLADITKLQQSNLELPISYFELEDQPSFNDMDITIQLCVSSAGQYSANLHDYEN